MNSLLSAAFAVTGSTGTTTVVFVLVLVALGSGMVVLAVWLVRATRTDTPVLGPLEVMGGRRWRRSDAERRAATLAEARPAGALGPAPMVPFDVPAPVSPAPEPAPLPAPAAAAENGEPSMQGSAPTAHPADRVAAEPPTLEPPAVEEPSVEEPSVDESVVAESAVERAHERTE